MFVQKKHQADGLETKVLLHRLFGSAAMVTLVEKKVDGLLDRLQALGYFRRVGDFHESPRKPEHFPRPAQSFFDGILAGQEDVRDFRNAEAAKRLKDEGHLGFARKLRITARKHHAELVVSNLLTRGIRKTRVATFCSHPVLTSLFPFTGQAIPLQLKD